MPVNLVNPYSGEPEETCSVSFAAQQQMAGTVGSPQTEAQYNASKLLGEWGVIAAKLKLGIIPNGTKLMAYTNATAGSRGYLYVKGGALWKRSYLKSGDQNDDPVTPTVAEFLVKSSAYQVSIPYSAGGKKKPEPVVVSYGQPGFQQSDKPSWSDGQVLAVNANGQEYLKFNKKTGKVESWLLDGNTGKWVKGSESLFFSNMMDDEETWHKPDGKPGTTNVTPATTTPSPAPTQVAAPMPTPPVNSGSTSVGSMSHEDVAAMFVKIKDDLAKEKGLNIKGANPALDEEVYQAIGKVTGYSSAEVKAKIDAYKGAGNKLSALKKKVLAGTKQVPSPQPQAAPKPSMPLIPAPGTPIPDPKPHGVPTVATPAAANAAKNAVKQEAAANPTKVYSDEDVAAAYIIAKDKIVAESNGKWTLYTKSDELDLDIAIAVGLKTGMNPTQQKVAIANYLASGKKLSVLKKQLIKQGAMKAEAATLKKSGSAKTQAEKDAEAAAKAAAGYTPTSTPATGTPPTATGSPAPTRVKKRDADKGDISGISDADKATIFNLFKGYDSQSYLSSGPGQNYEAFVKVQQQVIGEGKDWTLLQLVRVVDEHGAAKAGVANGHLFENQVVKWLTTPAGTQSLKDKEKQLAKAAQQAKDKAEIEKKAKLLGSNQPPLPADSAQYQEWSLEKARRISNTWLAQRPWSDKERRDLRYYTGDAYVEMNAHLRSGAAIDFRGKSAVQGAKAGMRPTTEPILVKRGTGLEQFSSLGVGKTDEALVWGLTGKRFKDEGFLSTSAGGRAAFGREATLEIECPVGTPMAYVAPISQFPNENEMLLQAGMEYQVLNVRRENGQYVIRLRVVNWPGKVN